MSINENSALNEDKDQIEYELFCDSFEQQYTQAKEDGVVEQDAPMAFLTQ